MSKQRWFGILILLLAFVVHLPARAELSPPSKATSLRWPVLRQNSRGVEVRALQRLLSSRGYQIAVDGRFGTQTRDRVRTFQRARRLTVDGIVGRQTWEALVFSIRRGARGSAVSAAQELLRRSDINVAVDGVFGRQTETGVRRFQGMIGLDENGVVNRATWCYLLGGRFDGE